MKITLDTSFDTRNDLETYIRSRVGDDANKNRDHEIEVSTDEAQKYQISEDTTIYGVRVKIV